MSAFAFAPNGQRTTGETTLNIGGDRLGSNNDDSVMQTSFRRHSCDFCHAALTPKWKGNRFCSHACYCDWMRAIPIAPRLWTLVNKNGPIHPGLGTCCWNWLGPRTGSGSVRHGQIMWSVRYQRSPQKVHRVVWELERGPIPTDRQINHRCDNPICVRLDHLYLGTQDENMKDAAGKQRLTVPRTRKLSLFDRLTIYRTPAYRGICVALARQYGVTKPCISLIRSGRFLGSGVWSGTKQAGVDVHTTVTVRRTA